MSRLAKKIVYEEPRVIMPRQTVIYYCKKCDLLRKGTVDEDVALFWEHKDPMNVNQRCLLKDEYLFSNGKGSQDVNIFVMTPK